MSKPLLLVLHGVGAHGHDWAKPVLELLTETADSFPGVAARGKLSAQVEIVPLRYDDIFDQWLKQWEAQGSKLKEFGKASAVKLPRLSAALNDTLLPDAERGFFWSHAFDAISYRGVSIIRDQVRAKVMAEIVAAVNAHLAKHPGADVSILAHSLGTIVSHDVLAALATGKHGEPFKAGKFRFSNLFLLANAVKLGPSKLVTPKPDETAVRPVSAGPMGGLAPYLSYYYSFRHEWDPIPNWQPFAPGTWGPGFINVKIRHLHQVNVHGYEHYLKHPDVHVRILRGLLGWDTISDSEWHQRRAEFPDVAPNACGNTVTELIQRLDALRGVATDGSLDEIAMGLFGIYRAVREARRNCEALFNETDGWL